MIFELSSKLNFLEQKYDFWQSVCLFLFIGIFQMPISCFCNWHSQHSYVHISGKQYDSIFTIPITIIIKKPFYIQYHKVPRENYFATFCYNRRKSVNLFSRKSYKWTRRKKKTMKYHLVRAYLTLLWEETNVMQKINITCKFCASKTRKQK